MNRDAYDALRDLTAASVDTVVTDPPYAIRVPKSVDGLAHPLGHTSPDLGRAEEWKRYADADMLGQQSANWHARATRSRGYADNDPAHFQRWCELWLTECMRVLKPGGHLVAFGGTRTWHRLATAAEDVGFEVRDSLAWMYATGFPKSLNVAAAVERQSGTVARAHQALSGCDWQGWGTALKPAFEPVVFARAPLVGTVAANVVQHRTGAINIDATRLDGARWPTNVFLDEHQSLVLDASIGQDAIRREQDLPSRFCWHAKPSRAERERVAVGGVRHPTVKPVALMRELVRLTTPSGGTVLDPFAGSGTTVEAALLEGMSCIAFERDPSFIPLIEARIDYVSDQRPVRREQASVVADDVSDVLF